MKILKRKIWLFILLPIFVLAVAGCGAYFYLQTKLKATGNSSNREIVNAMIKEVITHPGELKKMMKSITITDKDTGTSSDGKGTITSSLDKRTPVPSPSSTTAPNKRKNTSSSPSIFSLKYIKAHLSEYELLSTGAKNLGGNTYRLTATVRHKPTGKIGTVGVTTQLSESMKATLRKYRK